MHIGENEDDVRAGVRVRVRVRVRVWTKIISPNYDANP